MSINARLAQLEDGTGVDRCPACNYPLDGSISAGDTIRFNICTDHNAPPPAPCVTCGRVPMHFTLNIGTIRPGADTERPEVNS